PEIFTVSQPSRCVSYYQEESHSIFLYLGGKTLTKSLQASSRGFYPILAKSPRLMNLFCPGYRQYEHDLEFLLSILYI
ncbi:MAG TPA: hypothetical protein VJ250_07565, partial [Nitrososphaeraceae archaeon]|nr:hypothetical protein [Nitrososphaeraceae archaeon]